jgi:hypothetical protein
LILASISWEGEAAFPSFEAIVLFFMATVAFSMVVITRPFVLWKGTVPISRFGMVAIPVSTRSDGFVRAAWAAADVNRMVVAIHEAGHAVAALSLSIQVRCVTLEACSTRRRDDPIAHWSQAVVAMAGPAAEQKFAGYPPDRLAMMWRSAWKTDRRNAYGWLRRMDSTVTLKQTEAMAAHLVAEHWDAIVRVAEALAAESELSGPEISALM